MPGYGVLSRLIWKWIAEFNIDTRAYARIIIGTYERKYDVLRRS